MGDHQDHQDHQEPQLDQLDHQDHQDQTDHQDHQDHQPHHHHHHHQHHAQQSASPSVSQPAQLHAAHRRSIRLLLQPDWIERYKDELRTIGSNFNYLLDMVY